MKERGKWVGQRKGQTRVKEGYRGRRQRRNIKRKRQTDENGYRKLQEKKKTGSEGKKERKKERGMERQRLRTH